MVPYSTSIPRLGRIVFLYRGDARGDATYDERAWSINGWPDWIVNPFKPTVKNNKLIGRGANDMKSSIACFVAAVSKFKTKNKNFKGSISLLITGDEEGIAINGTKRVVKYLKNKREKINFCLVGEPTNPNKLGEMIKIGRRGSITGRLTIIGVQGHVAYPHMANNPSNTMIKILNRIKELKLDKGTKNFQPSNLEVTKINIDNHTDNVIPRCSHAVFNIRFNDKHSASSLKKKLNNIFRTITRSKIARNVTTNSSVSISIICFFACWINYMKIDICIISIPC